MRITSEVIMWCMLPSGEYINPWSKRCLQTQTQQLNDCSYLDSITQGEPHPLKYSCLIGHIYSQTTLYWTTWPAACHAPVFSTSRWAHVSMEMMPVMRRRQHSMKDVLSLLLNQWVYVSVECKWVMWAVSPGDNAMNHSGCMLYTIQRKTLVGAYFGKLTTKTRLVT